MSDLAYLKQNIKPTLVMKKANVLYALLFAVALISCKKDDESPTYKKADLIGSWTMTSSGIEQDDCDSYSEELEIGKTTMTTISTCDGVDGSFELDYTFNNKETITFDVLGIPGKLVITQLTSTTLKVDVYYQNVKQGTTTYTKQ
jgi:hypothetical protein